MKIFCAVLFACVCLSPRPLTSQAAAPASAPAASGTCPVDQTPPSEADQLLSRGKDKEAQAAYQALLQKAPGDERARLGLIRTMISQGQVQEATKASATFVKEQPRSGTAQLAAFEAAYRSGDIDDAFANVKQAIALAPCNGEASMGLAQLYDLTGLHASAAHFTRRAHFLRPNEQFITREWINTLPRAQRLAELTAFLQSNPAVSEEALHGLNAEKQYLEAHKPGDCRVVSASDSAQVPLTAIYGPNTRPTSFGLEVAFDGKKRRMEIDTGASGILLSESAARGLAVQQEVAVKTAGIGAEGARESYLSHVHSLRIGAVELQDCVVRVVKDAGLHSDGLIGMDVFRRWLVTLDYPAAQLRLSPLAKDPKAPGQEENAEEADLPRDSYIAPEMQNWLHVARIGHDILLPAALKPNGTLHYMIMDTGAFSSTLSLPMANEAGKLRMTTTQIVGISGKTKDTYVTQDTSLYIGSLHLLPDSYYATDLTNVSDAIGFEVGGLFGFNTLQRLVIQMDYRDNLVKLTYDPKHDIVRF